MGKRMTEEEIEVEQNNEAPEKKMMKYDECIKFANAIAKPMAGKKLNKNLMKLTKQGKEHKSYLYFGLKDVQARIRKGERGLVLFAGDVTPIDVMCHMPGVCEEKDLLYCYVPSKRQLAHNVGFTVNGTCLMVLIKEHADYKELYDQCCKEVKFLGHPM